MKSLADMFRERRAQLSHQPTELLKITRASSLNGAELLRLELQDVENYGPDTMKGMYILDKDKNPVAVDDALEWARWYQVAENRVVGCNFIGFIRVSTVCLGLDHNFTRFGSGAPVLFETMIFDGLEDSYCERCCTWDEAVEQHKRAVALVKRYHHAGLKEVSKLWAAFRKGSAPW